jgi:chemotaxis protein MotB
VEGQNIIIRKVKKKGHGGHHGGSWKVAYADFVTAMMAFFLLLWLITMTAPEKRARVSNYFKYFTLFEKGGSSMLEMNKKTSITVVGDERMEQEDVPSDGKKPLNAENEAIQDQKLVDDLEEKLKKGIASKLADVKDQIVIDTFKGGVRVELVDKEGGRPMFAVGSTELTPEGKKILSVIAENVRNGSSKIALEGHTDARVYPTKNYSNWELSTERASAARKELERNGLVPDNLIRVAGYAATEPLVKNDPYDPRNRRISIVLFHDGRSAAPRLTLPAAQGTEQAQQTANQPAPPQQQEEVQKTDTQPLDPIQQYLFKR